MTLCRSINWYVMLVVGTPVVVVVVVAGTSIVVVVVVIFSIAVVKEVGAFVTSVGLSIVASVIVDIGFSLVIDTLALLLW